MTKCKICTNRKLDCCELPIFKESEAIEIIEKNAKEIKKANVYLQRYSANTSTWTFIPKKYQHKEQKYYKLILSGKERCPFLIKNECSLKENKPFYCKAKREENVIIKCPLLNLTEEELKNKPIKELKNIKEKVLNGKNIDRFIAIFYAEDLARKPIKIREVNPKKDLVVKKDEILWTLIFHSLIMNGETKYNRFYETRTEKRIAITPNNEVVINTNAFIDPKDKRVELKQFTKKINNLMTITLHTYSVSKIEVLIQKTQSIINGVDKKSFSNEDLKENYQGFLLALALLRLYQDNYKNKLSVFSGIFTREEINSLGDIILERLYEEGKDEVKIFDKIGEFALKVLKRVKHV